jgi:membrane protease YdiL (CAAX protease family)
MSFDGLINTVLVVISAYVYISLLRQISYRHVEIAPVGAKTVDFPEAVVAVLLAGWFSLAILASASGGPSNMRSRVVILTAVISLAVVLVLGTFLRLRRLDIRALGGFSRLSFGRIVSTAGVLLFAAYPLIFLADAISQRVLGRGSSKQQIVEMFSGSQTMQERIIIIVLAVAVAPLVEEFIFRFFFYGVIKRYLGRSTGLLLNALLFAAVHVHLPSFGPLFVLGSCFTLAYEWSGSILVPMTMHAFFNFLTLTALAFPDTLPQ